MKESDFYEWLETQPVEDKIVSIKYKYSHEKEWTQSNEILEVDLSYEDVYVWLDDWDEGQQDIEILGCIPVSDINVPIFDRKIENNSEKPNNCEHITEDGVTCAKYPACDDCLDNPLNKLKGSERLVKGSEKPNNCKPQTNRIADKKPTPIRDFMVNGKVKDEPQTEEGASCRQARAKKFGEMDDATFKAHCMNCQRDPADIKCLDCDGNKYFLSYGAQTDCAWR